MISLGRDTVLKIFEDGSSEIELLSFNDHSQRMETERIVKTSCKYGVEFIVLEQKEENAVFPLKIFDNKEDAVSFFNEKCPNKNCCVRMTIKDNENEVILEKMIKSFKKIEEVDVAVEKDELKKLDEKIDSYKAVIKDVKKLKVLDEEKQLATQNQCDELWELVERNIPKAVFNIKSKEVYRGVEKLYGTCPNCGSTQTDHPFCSNCGQRIYFKKS
jgi:hypothetical protein